MLYIHTGEVGMQEAEQEVAQTIQEVPRPALIGGRAQTTGFTVNSTLNLLHHACHWYKRTVTNYDVLNQTRAPLSG